MTEPADAVLVDARGRRCPAPVIELARAADAAGPGALIRLLATDPASRYDVPAWCRMRGQRLVDVSEDDGALTFLVQTSRRG